MSNPQLRHLNFLSFIQQRSVQINRLTADLALSTKKKSHQSLPRSIRRRAMSHNKYRIGSRLRANMTQELSKAEIIQKVPRCRKHIRKSKQLMAAYQRRHLHKGWLSTHLWAAKRMHMIPYYHRQIALTPFNKCFRSAYRHFRNNCLLLDLSYLCCLRLTPTNALLVPNLLTLDTPATLYADQDKTIMVCPMHVFRNEQTKQLLCYFHPACREQVEKITFSFFTASVEDSKYDLYMVVGPQAINRVNEAVELYGLKTKQLTFNNNIQCFWQKNQMKELPKPFISNPISTQLKKQYKSEQNQEIRRRVLSMFQQLSHLPQPQAHFDRFQSYFQHSPQRESFHFSITTRSRYTHKRKNKLTKVEKKKFIQKQKLKKQQKQQPRLIRRKSSKKQVNKKQIQVCKQAPTIPLSPPPVLISTFCSNSLFKGCLVLCSNADNCKLWRILSKLNLKPVGRRQYRHLLLQSNLKCFPQDYVNTASYRQLHHSARESKLNTHLKHPHNKRTNYLKIHSKYPFGIKRIPSTIQTSVEVSMVSRGKCVEGSYLCQPTEEDMVKVNLQLEKNQIGIVCSEVEDQSIVDGKITNAEDYQLQLEKVNFIRNVVGFITSGGYIFSKAKEGGIGFVDQLSWNLDEWGGYLLVRKPTSKHYYLAFAQRIDN